MEFELTIDLCQPGTIELTLGALEAFAETARATQGLYLEASWQTDFGATDEIVSLWSTRDDRSVNAAGIARFLAAPLTASSTRQHRPLSLEMPFDNNFKGGHIYDFRQYRLKPGTLEKFLQHMSQALPVRKRHSRNVGVWTLRSGPRDQIIHVWAYKDLADRDRARREAWREDLWQVYLSRIFPLTERMQNALLTPVAFSPMQ